MNDRFKFRIVRGKSFAPFGSVGTILNNVPLGAEFGIDEDDIIEQCTGLKDKNGNLIYEGDIIRYCVNWRAYCLTYTRIVAWDKNTAGFTVVNGKTQVKPLQKWRFPDPETHIIEIVGNIHETKG